jgi:hypothetical protein
MKKNNYFNNFHFIYFTKFKMNTSRITHKASLEEMSFELALKKNVK